MKLLRAAVVLVLGLAAIAASRAGSSATDWDRVSVPRMKTSIYVGSVTLSLGTFEREGNSLRTSYEATVFPWFFWGETGRITITLPAQDVERLARGETVEFTGEAFNHKNKLRTVTGRAQPSGAADGKIKVRIGVDDTELIFNGTYHLSEI